jgi:hypothetical protein
MFEDWMDQQVALEDLMAMFGIAKRLETKKLTFH